VARFGWSCLPGLHPPLGRMHRPSSGRPSFRRPHHHPPTQPTRPHQNTTIAPARTRTRSAPATSPPSRARAASPRPSPRRPEPRRARRPPPAAAAAWAACSAGKLVNFRGVVHVHYVSSFREVCCYHTRLVTGILTLSQGFLSNLLSGSGGLSGVLLHSGGHGDICTKAMKRREEARVAAPLTKSEVEKRGSWVRVVPGLLEQVTRAHNGDSKGRKSSGRGSANRAPRGPLRPGR
jgi:hypothetical protein